ncbi:hypothetical protein LJR251_005910 [Rhizobium rhizogenes]|uniref:DUF6894 family protein n=1 Tax=Rhizobium rhizogenes TaxID=359 RepID=UPI003ED0F771
MASKRYFFEILANELLCPDSNGMEHSTIASAITYGQRVANEIGAEAEYRDTIVLVFDDTGSSIAQLNCQGMETSCNHKTPSNAGEKENLVPRTEFLKKASRRGRSMIW